MTIFYLRYEKLQFMLEPISRDVYYKNITLKLSNIVFLIYGRYLSLVHISQSMTISAQTELSVNLT